MTFPEGIEEEKLIRSLRTGDKKSFDLLYKVYH